jgi:hypothetical protein
LNFLLIINFNEFKVPYNQSLEKSLLLDLLSIAITHIIRALHLCTIKLILGVFGSQKVVNHIIKSMEKPIVLLLETLLTFAICIDILFKVIIEGRV